jgi:hypothetical protein
VLHVPTAERAVDQRLRLQLLLQAEAGLAERRPAITAMQAGWGRFRLLNRHL